MGMSRAGMIDQVRSVTMVGNPRCLPMGKNREIKYYRLGPRPQCDLSSPSMSLVI